VSCQKCGSDRILHLNCKHDDRFGCYVGDFEIENDYAPHIDDLCGGDYTDFVVCLDCGQMQGEFPKPLVEGLEDQDTEAEDDE